MLEAARSRIQTVHASRSAGVYAPRLIFGDAINRLAGKSVRGFVDPHPEMRTAGVFDQSESIRGSNPQSPGAIGEQIANPIRQDAIGLPESGKLVAVVTE
jgi:hypothetical protein